MPPMPAEAEAPPDLATPLTASPACSAARAIASSCATLGRSGSIRSRSGKSCASSASSASPAIFVFRRRARHRHRALGQRLAAVARGVVGRDHGLALAHQHAQAEIVAFGALAFLHRAVAHLDRQRHAAHRHRVGGIGAAAQRGLDQPLGAVGEGGLVEQGGGGGAHEGTVLQMGLKSGLVQPPVRTFRARPARSRQSWFATPRQSCGAKPAATEPINREL